MITFLIYLSQSHPFKFHRPPKSLEISHIITFFCFVHILSASSAYFGLFFFKAIFFLLAFQETAIQIANSCQLFSPGQTILTINASSLEETREALDNALTQLREDQRQLDMMADSNPSNMGSQTSLFSVLSLFSLSGGGGGAGEGLNHALVIDGKTLAFAISPELERRFLKICLHCRSVVCCRATPIQKVSNFILGVADQESCNFWSK